MPQSRKRKFIERDPNHPINNDNEERKKRKTSRKAVATRKSKRLANKKKTCTAPAPPPLLPQLPALRERKEEEICCPLFDHTSYLFDASCLYSFLEVFLVAYDIDIQYDLWEWLWIWEEKASSFYRILITPVYQHNLFEIRVDSIHGLPSGLLSEFLLKGLLFEYYYSYSRSNIWGGWKFCLNKKIIKQDIYGNIFNNNNGCGCIQPSKIWKQIIWFKQLKMELMYKKYGGINMNKMHLTHYFYGHHKFNEIDGNHDVYINHFPPYQINNESQNNNKKNKKSKKQRAKFDVYSYHMAQIFDNVWCKTHEINENSIKLNVDDLSLILGTKQKMRCAQCYQTFHICRAIKLCDCFKGCFLVKDLYQRHKSMVMDWK